MCVEKICCHDPSLTELTAKVISVTERVPSRNKRMKITLERITNPYE